MPENPGAMVLRLKRPTYDPEVYVQAFLARLEPVGTDDLASIACRNLDGSRVSRSDGVS